MGRRLVREHKVPAVPNMIATWDQFCSGQEQEKGWKDVIGALNKERWQHSEWYTANLEVSDMVDI